MKINASLLYAVRLLKPSAKASASHARKSLFGAMMGIGLSLIPLIVVLVVANGMIEGISSRMIELSSYHIQVIDFTPASKATDLSQLKDYAAEIEVIPQVQHAFVERQGLALIAGTKGRSGATIRSVSPDLFIKNTALADLFTVYEGELSLPEANSALIGKKLADTIGAQVGDTVRLISAVIENGNSSQTGTANAVPKPRVRSFVVSGIISSGYQELDALWVYIPLEAGFSLLGAGSSRTLIGIQTSDAFADLQPLIQSIKSVLHPSFSVYSWYDLNEGQYKSFETTRLLLLFIMFLIVLVASVNVSSALVMLILERRKEIAILKSLGASVQGIQTSFLFAGFCTGLGGVIIGVPLGIFFALNINLILEIGEKILNFFSYFMYILGNAQSEFIPTHLLDPAYYLETIPITIPFWELCIIAAGTILLSVLVSIAPIVRASTEKPLSALRKF